MADFYNDQVAEFSTQTQGLSARDKRALVDEFIELDPTRISWSAGLKQLFGRSEVITFETTNVRPAIYPPLQ